MVQAHKLLALSVTLASGVAALAQTAPKVITVDEVTNAQVTVSP